MLHISPSANIKAKWSVGAGWMDGCIAGWLDLFLVESQKGTRDRGKFCFCLENNTETFLAFRFHFLCNNQPSEVLCVFLSKRKNEFFSSYSFSPIIIVVGKLSLSAVGLKLKQRNVKAHTNLHTFIYEYTYPYTVARIHFLLQQTIKA